MLTIFQFILKTNTVDACYVLLNVIKIGHDRSSVFNFIIPIVLMRLVFQLISFSANQFLKYLLYKQNSVPMHSMFPMKENSNAFSFSIILCLLLKINET